ncbi:MAG TPA: hypothetical protein PKO05_01910 [Thermoanaerobaculia bacterium]|jgi:hypothetical protein|nr:MAG: hypothetical protein BWX64_00119 [Acidobacteria bacterium ADurb.Bin051]HNU82176.1 hypothetical protein [Thermoanaerobaculia bacterium]
MSPRRLLNRLYYFTVEDEGILAEAFPRFETESFCVAYKVVGTDDVFVATAETKDAMDRQDLTYNLLGEEDSARLILLHNQQSKEELGEYEDALKALALAHRAIAMACVGVNGDRDLGLTAGGARDYTYFTAPAGHTFIWRLFSSRKDAAAFLERRLPGDRKAQEWAETLPLASANDLKSFQ